jgi:hypothetical protein
MIWGMFQGVEHLPSMHKALSSTPSIEKNPKEPKIPPVFPKYISVEMADFLNMLQPE